jgi:site-specific DNA recombinase
MTGEHKKGKYVYYHCTGYHGKCPTPWFSEAEISSKLGQVLQGISVPGEIVTQLNDSLQRDQERVQREFIARKERLEKDLDLTRRRQDQAYTDKLDGKITEDFWNRQMSELTTNEPRIASQLAALTEPHAEKLLTVARALELAQKAHFMYLAQDPVQAEFDTFELCCG